MAIIKKINEARECSGINFNASIFGCSKSLKVHYIKEGEILTQKININDYIDNHENIKFFYIDKVNFAILDSISFHNNNPEEVITYSTPVYLNFSKEVKNFSPEYYAIGTAYYISKGLNYYNNPFDGKLKFGTQNSYKSIDILFGDIPLLTTPKLFIFKKKSPFSPSIFYHEIGHRAFWLIESDLGIKFKGLSYIHMGLLEYFTVSLNNSPLVGECVLPPKLIRDASLQYTYPPADSLNLSYTFYLLKESYFKELQDSTNNISRYYNLSMKKYGSLLKEILDTHRAALVITNTLWHIREKLGQEKTDKLLAKTILELNNYMSKRIIFYNANEKISDKINWYDLYYGLLEKDKELFNGDNNELIKSEFKKTGFPIEKVK